MNKEIIKIAKELQPKKFDFSKEFKSISEEPFKEHRDVLYQNYVKNYNKISKILQETDFSKIEDIPSSTFAHLKRRVIWAANGAYLHELYFRNISGKNTKPGKCTSQLIKRDFKNFQNFKDYFSATAMVQSSGWAVWGYALYDQTSQMIAVESHHNNCQIGFFPILVLDMWEHAYWADHFADKKKYVQEFWEDVDWNVVEERCQVVDKLFKLFE